MNANKRIIYRQTFLHRVYGSLKMPVTKYSIIKLSYNETVNTKLLACIVGVYRVSVNRREKPAVIACSLFCIEIELFVNKKHKHVIKGEICVLVALVRFAPQALIVTALTI